ncbi:hypothetical protein LITTLEE_58 [Mycobacterium phage LittleE]|uniref:Uncharacterized protein n=1 Tax=Mycobacterium phage LittleE TaxID=2922212 RepID=G1D3U3_9CAUD|nr:hypothetical protein FGG27_gp058 [Mycobacterium phage LittleE]AEK09441.1 hypothetical protein LITTLEE_58 [Mycobacterium phage LittleE]
MDAKVVTHRLSFPITREIARRALIAGAMVTNRLTADYLDSHLPHEEEPQPPVGMYL